MTSGYVFRVENPATVLFLQKVGKTGHLTTLSVSGPGTELELLSRRIRLSEVAHLACLLLTVATTLAMVLLHDWWAVVVVAALVFARLVNAIIIKRRAVTGWKGASEPVSQAGF